MHAASTPVEIVVANGSEREQRARDVLLDKWRYAETVRIESFVIPHSHPVLTLNTLYVDDPDTMLTEYVHEQLHWFWLLESLQGNRQPVYAHFRDEFLAPIPIDRPEGCGNEFSNLLHVPICYLELLGLTELVGRERARDILGRQPFYTALYELVLKEGDRIHAILEAHNHLPPDLPPMDKRFIVPDGKPPV